MSNAPATPPRTPIRVSRQWLELLPKLPTERGRLIVIGGSDTGKTTLCRWLLSKLPETSRPALVDSDLGQATVGPPACVGWRFAGSAEAHYTFVGDTTPATNPLAALTATVRAVQSAEAAGAGIVLLDTSGYLGGRGGYELKNAKLEVLAPLHVILLGDSPDVRRLLAAWSHDARVTLHRVTQSEVLVQKTRPQRAQWRQERFAEALAGGELRKIPLAGKTLGGPPTPAELRAAGLDAGDLQGLLLCFHDRHRNGLCLGLLQALDLPNHQILARAPQVAEQADGLQFGLLKLTAEGQELGRLEV